MWRKERVCGLKVCRSTFMPVRRAQKYCSPKCRVAAWDEERTFVRLSEKGVQRRSLRTDIRNPLFQLSCAKKFKLLDENSQKLLRILLSELAADAKLKAQKAWDSHKGPMAAYWKAVSVYAAHARRLMN